MEGVNEKMAYIDFLRDSDKKVIRLKIGKITGIKYKTNGEPNWYTRETLPRILYYGDSVKKLINPNVDTDKLSIIRADGSIWTSINIISQEFSQLLTGLVENDTVSGAIVANKKGKHYAILSSSIFGGALGVTYADSLGYYDEERSTIRIAYGFDDMLVYDFDNQFLYSFPQDELLYTGGAFAPNIPVGTSFKLQPISYVYATGKRRFSDLPPYPHTVLEGGELGLKSFTINGKEMKLYKQYLNDNRYSNIGDTAKSDLATFPENASFLNRTNLRELGKYITTNLTNPVDKDENANPNEDEDKDGDEDGGKKGDKDDTTDYIPRPPVPDLEITQSIIKMFTLTPTQLRELSANLWSLDIFQQLYNVLSTPIDCIISLYMIVCGDIPTGNEEYINFGNIQSNVKGKTISNSHIIMKSNNIYVPLYYGNFHDYMNTKIQIFLPYCGLITLPNYVLGNSLNVQYDIDLVSGNALITIATFIQNQEVVFDRRTINMAYRIPLSGKDSAQYVGNVWNNPISILTDSSHVNASNIEGNAQYFDVNYPYLLIERNNLAIPSQYGQYTGIPNENKQLLGALNGFTKVKDIKLNIPNATKNELNEIYKLLKGGIYI